MNEILMNMPIPSGIFSVLKHKIPNNKLKNLVLSGYRFDVKEAQQNQILDKICS